MEYVTKASHRAIAATAEVQIPDVEVVVARARRRKIARWLPIGIAVPALIALVAIVQLPLDDGETVVVTQTSEDRESSGTGLTSLPTVRSNCTDLSGTCAAGFDLDGVSYNLSCGSVDPEVVGDAPIAMYEFGGGLHEVRELTADSSRTVLAYRSVAFPGCGPGRPSQSEWALAFDPAETPEHLEPLVCRVLLEPDDGNC